MSPEKQSLPLIQRIYEAAIRVVFEQYDRDQRSLGARAGLRPRVESIDAALAEYLEDEEAGQITELVSKHGPD